MTLDKLVDFFDRNGDGEIELLELMSAFRVIIALKDRRLCTLVRIFVHTHTHMDMHMRQRAGRKPTVSFRGRPNKPLEVGHRQGYAPKTQSIGFEKRTP